MLLLERTHVQFLPIKYTAHSSFFTPAPEEYGNTYFDIYAPTLMFTPCPRVSIAKLKQDPKQLEEENIFSFQARIPHYSPPVKEAREENEHVRQLEVGVNVAP